MKRLNEKVIAYGLLFLTLIILIISILDISAFSIEISKAKHLNENKRFISDIYEYVKAKDNIWSETINNNEYVRVTFVQKLTKENDITIYPRITSGNPIIEVYEKDSDSLIAEFTNLINDAYNKVYLTNLISESQDTFDLRVVGGSVEIEHIIDPPATFISAGNVVSDLTPPISLTPTCPTHQANDILIVSGYYTDAGTDTMTTATSGWVPIAELQTGTDDTTWWWKRAPGAGTAGPTITTADDDLFAICYVIRGTITTETPFEAGFATLNNLTTSIDDDDAYTATISTGGTDRLVAHFYSGDDDTAWSVAPPPAGWELEDNKHLNSGTDVTFTIISKNVSSASTVPSVKIGTRGATELSAGLTIAFIPEPTADTTKPDINITYPLNNSVITDTEADVNYTRSDAMGLTNCWYSNDSYQKNTSLGATCNNVTAVTWTLGPHNVTIWANDTSGNINWSRVNFTVSAVDTTEITINATITDTTGTPLNSTVEISYAKNSTIIYSQTNETQGEVTLNSEELYDLKVNPHELDFIEEVVFKGVNLTNFIGETINLIEVEEIENDSDFEIIHIINPLVQDFTNATMTIIPGAKRLYECADWNTTSSSCNENWTQLNNRLIAGQEYNITLQNSTSAYGEIPITNALHLNSNREFISNVFEQVRYLDGTWSETIPSGDYVRVTFLTNLTSENDITIYPRTISGNPSVEVYERNESTLIINFTSINDNQYNKLFLTSLSGTQNIFDLRVVGGSVEFDHIIDPTSTYTINADASNSATGAGNATVVAKRDGGNNVVRLDNNNIIAYWIDAGTDASCADSTTFGRTWSTYNSYAGTHYGPAVATNGSGVAWVHYGTTGAGDTSYKYNATPYYPGTPNSILCNASFQAFLDVNAALTTQREIASVAYDGVNNRFVLCAPGLDGDLDFAYSSAVTSNAAITWTAVAAIGGDRNIWGCSIDVTDSGNVFIAAEDETSASILVFNSSAGAFASTTTRTAYQKRVYDVDLNIRGEELLITAVDYSRNLTISHSSDGITWTNATYPQTAAGNDSQGCIDANNNYHVIFVNGTSANIAYAKYSGGTFNSVQQVATTGLERWPSARCSNFPANNRLDSDHMDLVYTDTGTNIYFTNFTIDTSGAGDTCTYTGGDWNINCVDACTLGTATDGSGNRMIMTGSGNVIIDAQITDFSLYHISGGCNVRCRNGCIKYD